MGMREVLIGILISTGHQGLESTLANRYVIQGGWMVAPQWVIHHLLGLSAA